MRQSETQISLDAGSSHSSSSNEKNSAWFYEAGQLRRAKMHAAHLIESLDGKKMLPPSLHRLLEASLILETTNTKILAAYLQQSPAIIRNEFQRICAILGPTEELQKASHIKTPSITKAFAWSEK
ncbi:hypothetical protein [Nitrosomonas sp.]|uniref:hypothetical protein n=1 Tax=Nitrosomonas sp. TaxID=42353 RepID=UPI00263189D1|nr:hypothetical protein [Nitrosomonas sp.]